MDNAIAPSADALRPKPKHTADTVADEGTRKAKADERALAGLTKAAGWNLFVERYRARVLKLKTLDGVVIQGKTPAEVGTIYLVATEAASRMEQELEAILSIAAVIDEQTEAETAGK